MNGNKKLVVTVAILAIAVLAVVTGLVVVLVANTQQLTSKIKMQYTAQNVHVKMYATLHDGETEYIFQDGDSEYLELTPSVTTGYLSQPDTSVQIELASDMAVFEYKFENMSTVGANITLTNLPSLTNFALQYCVSDTQIIDFANGFSGLNAIGATSSYVGTQALGGNIDENTHTELYIYIIAQPSQKLSNGTINGNFVWSLSRA